MTDPTVNDRPGTPGDAPRPDRAPSDGPGTTSILYPAAATAATTRWPGSEMPGVPASVIRATDMPRSSRLRMVRT